MQAPDWVSTNPVSRRVLRFVRLAWRAWNQFIHDYCPLLSAALSFYGLTSLIPLCFIALWVLSHWFGPDEAQKMVERLVQQHVPQASDVLLAQVEAIRHGSEKWMTGSLWGLLPLVWAGSQFYETLERVLTAAWARRPLRGFLHRKLITFLTLFAAAIFFGLSLLATSALTTITHLDIRIFGVAPRDFPWLWRLVGTSLPYTSSVLMFFLVYKFLPNAKVPTVLASKAAAVVGVLWEYSKSLFSQCIAREQTYQHLYGSLTGVIVLMFWIYLSAVLLLWGAELAAAYHFDEGDERQVRSDEKDAMSPAPRFSSLLDEDVDA